MHEHRTRLRRTAVIGLTALGLTLAGTLIGPAQALNAPSGLADDASGSSTPLLSWSRVGSASSYQVQVDNDSGFGSPEYSVSTVNSKAVPTSHLRPGTAYWRVRAVSGSSTSGWVSRQIDVAAADTPSPLQPEDGAELPQPESPPLLRWTVSKGATSYKVEVDGDSDFIGAKAYTTKSTSLVVPDPLGDGDWWWRVTADKGNGITSAPSIARNFVISPLQLPQLTFPNDSFDQPVEDVVLDWEPVPGAKTYDLQVALNNDFNNPTLDAKNIYGTRYSPPTTLNNDEFWWRVRAVDAAGQPTPWQESRYNFKREWLDRPSAVFPLGSWNAPGVQRAGTTYFTWTPVQHASLYEVEVAKDINFTNGLVSCVTAGTTFVPRFTGRSDDCLVTPTSDGAAPAVFYWRVRPVDGPYNAGRSIPGLPGVFSAPQAFYRLAAPARTGAEPTPDEWQQRRGTGLQVAMTGAGLTDTTLGCTGAPSIGFPDADSYTKPGTCAGLTATPVLSWDRQPDMDFYRVWFAQDENFTTTEVQPITTQNTMLSLDWRDRADTIQLPDSEAGRPYYWYVQPCRTLSSTSSQCGPRPDSQAVGLSGAGAFEKSSPPVTGLVASDPSKNDITFSWTDYHPENLTKTSYGETGTQSAHTYRIQVDDEPSFSDPLLDQAEVDQTTYTAGSKLYPEGTLFWRVQAVDSAKNRLTWSATAQVTKSTPELQPLSPVNSVEVAGTTPLEWQAQAYAQTYEVEVYRNDDTNLSQANRVLSMKTRNASYAPTNPFPAASRPYVWRVRRIDASTNPGPWSAPRRFVSLGSAPELLSPTDGSRQPRNGVLLKWTDVPGAASYKVEIGYPGGYTRAEVTAATALAPTSAYGTGNYTWSVTARDSAGQELGTSGSRRFSVDATGPQVLRVAPTTVKPASTFKITFSERVRGISTRSIQLKKGNRAVRAVVKSLYGGKVATLNPTNRLRRGTVYTLVITSRIKDRAGNALTSRTWSMYVR